MELVEDPFVPLDKDDDVAPGALGAAGKVKVAAAQFAGCSAITTSTPTSELNCHTASPLPDARHVYAGSFVWKPVSVPR